MSLDRSPRARLIDARDFAREAQVIAASSSNIGAVDARDYKAIRYCLLVVGEALSRVPASILQGESAIPWRRVIALRHRLVHAYWFIDEEALVKIARDETAALIAALERLIGKMSWCL
jgi:uncharacterized protein with HEPN domain